MRTLSSTDFAKAASTNSFEKVAMQAPGVSTFSSAIKTENSFVSKLPKGTRPMAGGAHVRPIPKNEPFTTGNPSTPRTDAVAGGQVIQPPEPAPRSPTMSELGRDKVAALNPIKAAAGVGTAIAATMGLNKVNKILKEHRDIYEPLPEQPEQSGV